MSSVRVRHAGGAALTAMLLCVLPAAASSQSKIYALDDYPHPRAIPLQQWRSVLARMPQLGARWDEASCRDGAPALACAAGQAQRLEQQLQHLPPEQQIAGVYKFYNAFRYRHRRSQCGRDCWATPLEFIARRAGDCHDYVVAEYFSLRRLGFAEHSLQLMIVQLKGYDDPFAGGHMVLRVRLQDADYILDNRKKAITGLRGLRTYTVLAGLNADFIEIYDPTDGAASTLRRDGQTTETKSLHVRSANSKGPDSGACLQTATLSDWNSNLPCRTRQSDFHIKFNEKDREQ